MGWNVNGSVEEKGPDPGILDRIKGAITGFISKLLRICVILFVLLEIFVSGEKQGIDVSRTGIYAEMPDAEITREDLNLLDVLLTHAYNTDRNELELHGWYAWRNGKVLFPEQEDLTVRHIVYDSSPFQLDITYEKGKDREIQLSQDGNEYRKCVLLFDNLPGHLLGPIFGRAWSQIWGHYTCYVCSRRVRDGETLYVFRYHYEHNWFGWYRKVRDWDRDIMLSQSG